MSIARESILPATARLLFALFTAVLLAGAGLGLLHVLPRLEYMAEDLRARTVPGPPVSSKIIHVDIDDDTTRKLGKWPLSRSAHARVLDVLTLLEPEAVVYDVVFHGKGTPDEDADLEQAIARNGRVILGAAFQLVMEPETVDLSLDPDDLPLDDSFLNFKGIDPPRILQAERSFMPLARFSRHALGLGHVSAERDADGTVRSIPLLIGFNGHQCGALSLLTAMRISDFSAGAFTHSGFLPGSLEIQNNNSTVRIPVNNACLMNVHFPGPWKSAFPHIPFHILHDAADDPAAVKKLIPAIRGKTVLIGSAASGSTDLGPTPMGTTQPQISVHAAALNTLYERAFIRSSPWFQLPAAVILCLGVLLMRRTLSQRLFMAAVPALIPIWAAINFCLYSYVGTAVGIVSPLTAAGVLFLALLGMDYARTVKEVVRRRRERQILEIQFEAASRIQSHFLPEPPNLGHGSSVWAACVPAAYVGGDFYDVIPMRDGNFLIYLADVSGKGLPASLIMAAAWSRIRSEAALSDTPEEILERVNRSLYTSLTGEGHFITALFGLYDPTTGKLRYVDAGHMAPILCGPEGLKEVPAVKSLPLGVVDDAQYTAADIVIEPGDSVVFMSDGVTEAADSDRCFFGCDRVGDTLRELPENQKGPGLLQAVKKWRGSTPPNDDTTLVEIRRSY